jgi:hypothetical protein
VVFCRAAADDAYGVAKAHSLHSFLKMCVRCWRLALAAFRMRQVER